MSPSGKHASDSSSAFYRDLAIMAVGIILVGLAVFLFLEIWANRDTAPDTTGAVVVTSTTQARAVESTAQATTTTQSIAPSTTSSTAVPIRVPEEVRVIVLNSIQLAGAAGRLTQSLAEEGYQTLEADNLEPAVDPSKIWYRDGFSAEASELLAFLPGADIEPLPDPTIGEGADIVLVLGVGYQE